nr:hypothetical protein [Haladaptatus sp. R4]
MLRDHFQFATTFDNGKAKRDLNHEYTVDFETGVARTVEWLEENDEIDDWDEEPFEDALIEEWRVATSDVVAELAEYR